MSIPNQLNQGFMYHLERSKMLLEKEFLIKEVKLYGQYQSKNTIIEFFYDNQFFKFKSSSPNYEVIRGIVRKSLEKHTQNKILRSKREERRLNRIRKIKSILALKREKKKQKRFHNIHFRLVWQSRINHTLKPA